MTGTRPSDTKVPQGAPTRSGNNPVPRLLLVDDDNIILQLGAEVLTAFGYHVDTAEDGAAGWDALRAGSYDLLITDNNMPRVSGVELVKALRAARMTVPVVLVSGTIPTDVLNRDPSLQLAATLLKPFTMDELLGTVKKVLYSRVGARQQTEPEPIWPSRPSAGSLSLR
jgi:DNA-binding response OmpR family regulator